MEIEPAPADPPAAAADPPAAATDDAKKPPLKSWRERRADAFEAEFGGPQNLDGGAKWWLSDSDGDDSDAGSYDSDDFDDESWRGKKKKDAARAAAKAKLEEKVIAAGEEGAAKDAKEAGDGDGDGDRRKKKTQKKTRVKFSIPDAVDDLNDDDGLYGDELDDLDQKWANKQRGGRQSDAILSCPGCLEIVTIDCQKHARSDEQFRAMFVQNCVVADATTEMRGAEGLGLDAPDEDGPYREVKCETCDTLVGVRDREEVYHFFHVFPSHA
jgi:hypothetical protein